MKIGLWTRLKRMKYLIKDEIDTHEDGYRIQVPRRSHKREMHHATRTLHTAAGIKANEISENMFTL
jgi:hypothetical protein